MRFSSLTRLFGKRLQGSSRKGRGKKGSRSPAGKSVPLRVETLESRELLSTTLPTPVVVPASHAALGTGLAPTTPVLVADPLNPQNMVSVFATRLTDPTNGTIFGVIDVLSTTNGGETWTEDGPVGNLIDPNSPFGPLPIPFNYAFASSPSVAFDRSHHFYIVYSLNDNNNTTGSGAIAFQKWDFSTNTPVQIALQGPGGAANPIDPLTNDPFTKVLYQWVGQDVALNPTVAVDANVPYYVDPQTGAAQQDTMSGKAIYVAWNTQDAAPSGLAGSFNPNVIKAMASGDGGNTFTNPEFVSDGGYFSVPPRFGFAAPRIVFTQGTATAPPSTVAVTSIDIVNSIATVTTSAQHGFSTGDVVTITGASPAAYDGSFTITVTGPTTFTYNISTTPLPTGPATGTILASRTPTPTVPGGQLVFVWNQLLFTPTTGALLTDATQPDGGITTARPADAISFTDTSPTKVTGSTFVGGSGIVDAFSVSNGPDITGISVFQQTLDLNRFDTTTGADGLFDQGDPNYFFNSVADLSVTMEIVHPHDAHLQITLTGPKHGGGTATVTLLFNRIANDGTNLAPAGVADGIDLGVLPNNVFPSPPADPNDGHGVGVTFTDNAARNISDPSASAPFTASFRPEFGSLAAAFGGLTRAELQNSVWTLTIRDHRADGTTPPPHQYLRNWNLTFSAHVSTTGFGADSYIIDPATGAPVPTLHGSPSGSFPNASPITSLGIGPTPAIAVDNSLGSFDPFQGRLYVSYVNGSQVLLTTSSDGGFSWTSPIRVADDTPADGFSQGNRPKFLPEVAVDSVTGSLVVTFADTRWDAAQTRFARFIAVSTDGGVTFAPETFLNTPKTATDAITGKVNVLEPLPDNEGALGGVGVLGLGDRTGLVVHDGVVTAVWGGNENQGGNNILTATATFAAGPRIIASDMGPVVQDGSTGTYNDTFAADGTRQLDGFTVTFDRPIDPASFTAAAIKLVYRNTTTPTTSPGQDISSQITGITALNTDAPSALSIGNALVLASPTGNATAVFNVILSVPLLTDMTVDYTTSDGTAIAGEDYVPTRGTLRIPQGQTSGTISVPILNETEPESNQTFLITLSNPSAGATILNGVATGTIVDDNSPPALTIGDTSVKEVDSGTTPATFTVFLSNASSQAVTVDYTTADLTAHAGVDYVTTNGTITFAPNQVTQTITVPVIGNPLAEPNRVFAVELANPVGATLARMEGLGLIVDNHGRSLSAGDVTVQEPPTGPASATFNVYLNTATTDPVTVQYTTVDDTATAGVDYTATAGTLTFTPGQSVQSVTVPILDNTPLQQPNVDFFLQLSNPTNATLQRPQGVGSIVEADQKPAVNIGNASVVEGDSGTPTANFTVFLTFPIPQAVKITYSTSDGTGVAGTDYMATGGTLTIAAGQTSGTISVPIIPNQTPQPNRTFFVNLVTAPNANIAQGKATGTIVDDDVYVTIGDVTVLKPTNGNTNVTFPVFLNSPKSVPVVVTYKTVDGTAVAGTDYVATSGTLTIPVGSVSGSITVPIISNSTQEPDKDFTVQITAVTGASIAPAASTSGGVGDCTIVDTSTGSTLSAGSLSEFEGNVAPVTTFNVPVYLSSSQNGATTVNYFTGGGTAVPNVDYKPTFGTLTIPSGTTTAFIPVQVLPNLRTQPNRDFFVNLSNPSNGITIARASNRVLIVDDDGLSISIGDGTALESSSSITFPVFLSNPSATTVAVDYNTVDGTALDGVDYTGTQAGQVTFRPFQTSATITIPLTGDTTPDPNKTFQVQLLPATAAGAVVNNSPGTNLGTATGLIIDNNQLNFSVGDVTLQEPTSGSTTANFTVYLNAATTRTVTVQYTTIDNTASGFGANPDYTPTSGTLTFAPGQLTQTVSVPVLSNTIAQPNVDFFLQLSKPTVLGSPAVGIGIASNPFAKPPTHPEGDATIIDVDATPGITIANTALFEGNSGNTPANFPVYLAYPFAQPVTVAYHTTDSPTATAGKDYVATSGTLTFNPGQTTATIPVPVIGNTTLDGNKTFFVDLSNASDNNILQSRGTGLIVDDDGSLSLNISDAIVKEGNVGTTNATFTVLLTHPSSQTVTVQYSTADSPSAKAGKDYISTSGTLTFAPGVTTETINVPVIGNTTQDLTKTFFVDLANSIGATISKGVGTGTIVDDDGTFGPTEFLVNVAPQSGVGTYSYSIAPVMRDRIRTLSEGLSVSDVTVKEGTNLNAVFTVSLPEALPNDVTVQYATADGTGVAGTDYTSVAGTLLIPAGRTSGTVTVPLLSDPNPDPNETFTLNLSAPQGTTIARAQGTATLVDSKGSTVNVSIGDLSIQTSAVNTTMAVFPVYLNHPTGVPITISYATFDNSATADREYVAESGTVSFTAGQVGPSFIKIPILPSPFLAEGRSFYVSLFGPVDPTNPNPSAPPPATLVKPVGVGTIFPHHLAVLAVGDATVAEATITTFTVSSITFSGSTATATTSTANGFANGQLVTITGAVPASYNGTFAITVTSPTTFTYQITTPPLPVGPATGTIKVRSASAAVTSLTISGNTATATTAGPNGFVTNEMVTIAGASPAGYNGTFAVTVVNPTTFTYTIPGVPPVGPASGTITAVPQTQLTFPVLLNTPLSQPVTVTYNTSNGTASAGTDYTFISGTVTIQPGQVGTTITVPVLGDPATGEGNSENFTLTLSSPIGAELGRKTATGTLIDQGALPFLFVSDPLVRVVNGNNLAQFLVTLTKPSTQTLVVSYTTADGTATVNEGDYVPLSGSLTFLPGQQTQIVNVPVVGDSNPEDSQFAEPPGSSGTVPVPPEGVENFTLTVTTTSTGLILAKPTGTAQLLDSLGTPPVTPSAPPATSSPLPFRAPYVANPSQLPVPINSSSNGGIANSTVTVNDVPGKQVYSTVPVAPAFPELNPYGVAFVPASFPTSGTLQPGDLLVTNFNDATNTQGTGTTLMRITPQGVRTVFFTSTRPGLDGALGVLSAGFVIVGNVPSNGSGGVLPGALQILDKNGNLVMTLTDAALLADPWSLTVNDQGSTAQVFVSNVITGNVTRIDLQISGGTITVTNKLQIASGYATRLDAAAFVVGPAGLAYDPKTDTLYVASTAEPVNGVEVGTIFAVANAGKATTTGTGKGTVVFADPTYLHGPLGLVLAPNGDLVIANSDAVNADPNHPSELVEITPTGQFVSQFSVDPGTGGAFGIAVGSSGGQLQFAAVDDNNNTVTVWNFLPTTGVAQVLRDLTVTVDITYPNDRNLTLELVAPDGVTTVPLSAQNPQPPDPTGADYTNTTFDDQAPSTKEITLGSLPLLQGLPAVLPPYIGTFRPQTPLGLLQGINPNGTWTLRVIDTGDPANAGTINSWSLWLQTGTVSYAGSPGNYLDQNQSGTTGDSVRFPGDFYSVPAPLNGIPYQGPYSKDTLPLIVPGPHVVTGHTFTATQDQTNLRLPPVGTGGTGDPAKDVQTSQITVSGLDASRSISQITANLSIFHPSDSDLTITLIGPDGTSVLLSGGNPKNPPLPTPNIFTTNFINTTFDDSAGTPISGANSFAPYTGTFIPDQPLSAFVGKNPNGVWTLQIADNAQDNTGTLLNWSLNVFDDLVREGTNNYVDVTFDRNINPATFTPGAILRMQTPTGVLNLGPFGVTSLTISGNVAIATTAVATGFTTGATVTISGANQAAYNGAFPVIVTSPTSFMYTITGTPPSGPATGIITVSPITILPNPNGTDPNPSFPKTYRIGFPTQVVSGSYTLTLASSIQDQGGHALDSNLNAGLQLLLGQADPLNPTIVPVSYMTPLSQTMKILPNSTASFPLVIPDNFVIRPGTTLGLNINFPDDTQLEASLVAPDGTVIKLFTKVGFNPNGPQANFLNTLLADGFLNPIQSGTAPFTGSFSPQQALDTLAGKNSSGVYTLLVKNDSGSLSGTITGWSLSLQKPLPPTGLGELNADQVTTSFRIFTMNPNNALSHDSWTAVGPTDISSTKGFHNIGRVTSVAIDPADPSGNTAYVAAASGGIWKTSNFLTADPAGPTYVALTDFGPTFSLNIGSIAIFPTNLDPAQSFIIAGTGEGETQPSYNPPPPSQTVGPPSATVNDPSMGLGFLRSTDGGASWTLLDSTVNVDPSTGKELPLNSPLRDHLFVGTTTFKVVVDPNLSVNGHVIIYAALGKGKTASNGGLYRSLDGGNTWQRMSAGTLPTDDATDVVLVPASQDPAFPHNLRNLYVGIQSTDANGGGVWFTSSAFSGNSYSRLNGGQGNALIRQGDFGQNQTIPVAAPLQTPNGAKGRIILAVPPATGQRALDLYYQNWVYALVATTGGGLDGLYVSKDAGRNWTWIHDPALGGFSTNDESKADYNPLTGKSPALQPATSNYDMSLAVDPNNPDVVYVGGTNLFQPTPAGGLIRIDTTGISDPYAFSLFDNRNPAGVDPGGTAPLEANTKGPAGQIPLPFAPPYQLYTVDPVTGQRRLDSFVATPFLNLSRDPNNPFLANATLLAHNIGSFNNDGSDVRTWTPFGFLLPDGSLSPVNLVLGGTPGFQTTSFGDVPGQPLGGSSIHSIVSMLDPVTGLTRLIIGDDQGVFTGVSRSDGSIATGIGSTSIVNGNRNGNLQISQFYDGAAQPSILAGELAGALLYGTSQDNGAQVQSDPHLLSTGNLNWVNLFDNPLGTGTGVATDQTGTGTSYHFVWPNSTLPVGQPVVTNFFDVTHPGGGAPQSATTGLIQANGPYPLPDPQWAVRGGSNFAVNPINPIQMVIGSSGTPGSDQIFRTTDQGLNWFPIAAPGDYDGQYADALTYGAPQPGQLNNLDNFIYAGTVAGHIYVTFFGGGNGTTSQWINLSAGLLDNSPIMQIVASPVRGSHAAFAVSRTHVYFMADSSAAGATWKDITGNAFALTHIPFGDPNLTETQLKYLTSIAVDWRVNGTNGQNNPIVYIGGDGGVFRTKTAVQTGNNPTVWQVFPAKANGAIVDGGFLPNAPVTALSLSLGNENPQTGVPDQANGPVLLTATTYGRGTFAIRVDNNLIPGPFVVSAGPTLAAPPTSHVQVSFGGVVDPSTFTTSQVKITGPGGAPIAATSIQDITAAPPTLNVVSPITTVNGVATVTTTMPHNYTNSDLVTIAGAPDAGYNGTFHITVLNATQFTYVPIGNVPSTESGTMTATKVNLHNQYQINFAPQSTDGVYTVTIGPNITDFAGDQMDQDQDGVSGQPDDAFTFQFQINSDDNGRFLSGLSHDVTGQPSTGATMLQLLPPLESARFALLPGFSQGIVTAPETRGDLFYNRFTGQGLYPEFLGRIPSDAEVASWVQFLNGGGTPEQAINLFASGPEYYAASGSTDTGFVQKLYLDVLRRPADPTGLANALSFLSQAGSTPATRQVVVSFITSSNEYFMDLISNAGVASPISSITISGNTATVTTAAPHGLINGDVVTVQGADQAPYNGSFQVLVTSPKTFTYTVIGSPLPTMPATGSVAATTITIAGNTATVTTATPHGLATGNVVTITGAVPNSYNGVYMITVVDATHFSYTIVGTPPSNPATGTILVNKLSFNKLTGFYPSFLGRGAAQSEQLGWLPFLKGPAAGAGQPNRDEQVEILIIGSPEYFSMQLDPLIPGEHSARGWLESLYTNPHLLARSPSDVLIDPGFNGVLNAVLTQYQPLRQQDATLFVTSDAGRGLLVTNAYVKFLRRSPAPSEVANWVAALKAGVTDEQFVQILVSSIEYISFASNQTNLGSTLVKRWVNLIYQDVLGRTLVPGSLPSDTDPTAMFLVQILSAGQVSFSQVAGIFLVGPAAREYQANLVNSFYQRYLKRSAAPSELNSWVNALQSGMTDEQVEEVILSTTEYFLGVPPLGHPFP
jgi:subtilisin-like proprotein convertase family protein